jgi:excisionase family DNA binding protein
MPRVFRQQYTRPIPADAEFLVHKGKQTVRFKDGDGKRVIAFLTRRGDRCRVPSPVWYGQYRDEDGKLCRVPLCANKVAAEQMLAQLVNKAELGKVGMRDPFETQRARPLAEHLADFRRELEARDNCPRYVELVVSRLQALLDGCGFRLTSDLSASRVMDWLADLRRRGKPRVALPPGQEWFTAAEAAELLGMQPLTFRSAVRRNRLEATGNGKARRYSRAALDALQDRLARGASVRTSNAYLSHLKSFCGWLVKDRRLPDNPLVHLEAGNEALDRRHDRRELEAAELRHLLATVRACPRPFRGLAGPDRFVLYATACGTGFRASSLASLTPESFDLAGDVPTVTLPARHAKNRRTKVQPIPPDLAELVRGYMADKPAGQAIWGGTWARDRTGAEMLRRDLEAAGIPYVVQGPDGPLFADFHALRHSYLTLGGRAGIDLRTLQELAGHSTPELTARYSHRRLHDLAGAVEKLPPLLPDLGAPEVLAATGTDPAPFALTQHLHKPLIAEGPALRTVDGGSQEMLPAPTGHNPLGNEGVENGRGRLMAVDSRAGDRIRTGDVQLGKRVNASAQKPTEVLPAKTLRQSSSVCKVVRSLARTCENTRYFDGRPVEIR